jgi:hypothetical protein
MDERTKSMLWDYKTPLVFRGERYGWEVRFMERVGLFYSRGAFPLKELAVAWAWQERKVMEG